MTGTNLILIAVITGCVTTLLGVYTGALIARKQR